MNPEETPEKTPEKLKPSSVLLIIDSYPPVLGGSEIEAQRVSAGLIKRGHRVQVICAGGPPMPPVRNWTDPEGVPVAILTRSSRGLWKNCVFGARAAWFIWRNSRHYDVVYFLMQGLQAAAGLPVARFRRRAMVMKIAGSTVIPLLRQSWTGQWELGCLKRWKIPLLVLNQEMIEEAIADGFAREQVVWMPNPVDTEIFRSRRAGEAEEIRRRHGIPANAPVVIYVGRLSREKGLPGLLKGFAAVVHQAPDALLLIIGDGAMRSELEALARDLNLGPERIRFVGRVNVNEVPVWLRASDIYALTSPNEGFPCALLEAMSAGLPSVVSAIPANLQLVEDGVHGIAVQWDGEQAIGKALLRLFRDPEARERMGMAARQRVVERYSTDRVIERYEQLFASLR